MRCLIYISLKYFLINALILLFLSCYYYYFRSRAHKQSNFIFDIGNKKVRERACASNRETERESGCMK